jgi:hypothetical protein
MPASARYADRIELRCACGAVQRSVSFIRDVESAKHPQETVTYSLQKLRIART